MNALLLKRQATVFASSELQMHKTRASVEWPHGLPRVEFE